MSDFKGYHSKFNEMKFLQNQVCELSRLCVNKTNRENVWNKINAPPDWPTDMSWKNPTSKPKDTKESLKRKLEQLRIKTVHLLSENQKLILRLYDENKTSQLAVFMAMLKFLTHCEGFSAFLNLESTDHKITKPTGAPQKICNILDGISDRLKCGTPPNLTEGLNSQEITLGSFDSSASIIDLEPTNNGRGLGPTEQNRRYFTVNTEQNSTSTSVQKHIPIDQQSPKGTKRKRPSDSENDSRDSKSSKQNLKNFAVQSVTCFVIGLQPNVECIPPLPTDLSPYNHTIQPSRNSKVIPSQANTHFQSQPSEQITSNSSTLINSQLSLSGDHQSTANSDFSLSQNICSQPSSELHSNSPAPSSCPTPVECGSQRQRTLSLDDGFYSAETNRSIKSPPYETDTAHLKIYPKRISEPDVSTELDEIESMCKFYIGTGIHNESPKTL